MSDNDENVDIGFDVDDKVTPKLGRMEKAVGRLGGAVDRASGRFMGMVSQMGMMAGFFALGPAIAGAKHYIDHLDKISDLTGIASDKVGGISNALEDAGVSAGTVENVFAKLVKKGAQVGEGNKSLIKLAKQYGVTMKDGPEASLVAVSELMSKGKINAGQMQRILGVSSNDAAELADALSQGPGVLAAQIEEATKKNSAFTDEAMSGMQAYGNATARIGTTFNRLLASVMIKFAPALTKLADKFDHAIEGWASGAEKFGNFMVKHMDTIISMAKTYAKIMLVNVALQKVGMGGIGGVGTKVVGVFARRGATLAAAGAASGPLAVVSSLFKGLFSLRPIISAFTKFLPLGGVMMIVVSAVKALGENFNGITTRLKSTFGGIFSTVGRIAAKIGEVFSSDGPLGKLMGGVGYALLETVNKIGEVIGFILNMVEKIIGLIPDLFKGDNPLVDHMARTKYGEERVGFYRRSMKRKGKVVDPKMEAQLRASAMAGSYDDKAMIVKQAALPTAAKVPGKGAAGPQVYQDFRGSRFDITQAFAEGYDPDRIAVAFANDVSSMGEKKLQSGFSPLFAVR